MNEWQYTIDNIATSTQSFCGIRMKCMWLSMNTIIKILPQHEYFGEIGICLTYGICTGIIAMSTGDIIFSNPQWYEYVNSLIPLNLLFCALYWCQLFVHTRQQFINKTTRNTIYDIISRRTLCINYCLINNYYYYLMWQAPKMQTMNTITLGWSKYSEWHMHFVFVFSETLQVKWTFSEYLGLGI